MIKFTSWRDPFDMYAKEMQAGMDSMPDQRSRVAFATGWCARTASKGWKNLQSLGMLSWFLLGIAVGYGLAVLALCILTRGIAE